MAMEDLAGGKRPGAGAQEARATVTIYSGTTQAGMGSTPVAARRLGRRCLVVEVSPRTAGLVRRRLESERSLFD